MIRDDSTAAARVVLTGDYPLIRSAVARLIATEGRMDVVGECVNDGSALADAVLAAPDVVVMDVELDARDGGRPDGIAQLVSHARPYPVLILTRDGGDPQALSAALAGGAWGIVLKDRPVDVFLRAIRTVVGGEAWLEPATLACVFGSSPKRRDVNANLTRREREIVELVCLGLKNKKIGERLFISETTVRHHLTSIFSKLAVSSRLELMRYSYSGRVARE